MPPALATGRRFPRHLTHAGISAWSAEEALIFIRIGWSHLFQCIVDTIEAAGKVVATDVNTVASAFKLLQTVVLQLLDRRGFQGKNSQL